MSASPPHIGPLILVVEDTAADQVLIQEVLESAGFPMQVAMAGDGQEALECLRGSYRPDLILLDLNMPRLGGKELAARVKSDPALHTIPIVAFTTSSLPEDVASCYELGFNSYVQKPTDYDEFQRTLCALVHYWFKVSIPPLRRRS